MNSDERSAFADPSFVAQEQARKAINDGGPAFPTTKPLEHWGDPNAGMTLRDWFAGMALQALLSLKKTHNAIANDAVTAMETAGGCYYWADAMIAARERKESP